MTHPGSLKRGGRQIVQTRTDHSNRMVPSTTSFSKVVPQVAPTSDRPLCHNIQEQASPLCITGSASHGHCNRCIQFAIGRSGCPNSHIGQSGGEITRLPMQKTDSYFARVAQHDMVLGPGGDVQPDSITLASAAQPSDPAFQPDPSQKSVEPKSPCLVPRATIIKAQGFSKAVAARIEAPQRGSTRSVYEAKWTIFKKWCLTNQVDFRSPPV